MERARAGSAPAIPAGGAAPDGSPASVPAPCPARGTPPYLPRRPQASPLYRVLADHFATLERVHEERFEPTHGPLRRAARAAVGRSNRIDTALGAELTTLFEVVREEIAGARASGDEGRLRRAYGYLDEAREFCDQVERGEIPGL